MSISSKSANRAMRTGAALFFLWGILHVYAGVAISFPFIIEGPGSNLALFGIAVGNTLSSLELLGSHITMNFGFDLMGYGILAIWLSFYLWIGRFVKLSFWICVVLLGIADTAFIYSLLLPGYSPLLEGFAGPILYVLAVLFCGYGLSQMSKQEESK